MTSAVLPADLPFGEAQAFKSPAFIDEMNGLIRWHYGRCAPYRNILDTIYDGLQSFTRTEDLPFLPVRLFKSLDLLSVPRESVFKTLTSSGTSSQQPSRIFLDKDTAVRQTRVLSTIVKSFLGPKRLPLAIVDFPAVLKDRQSFSARGAGILGFSSFGHDPVYLLNDDMQVNWDVVDAFLTKHAGTPIFLFGFTFMVWKYLYEASIEAGRRLDFGADSTLIHGGGWKKLLDRRVSNDSFKAGLREQLGIGRVYNYYGMVEQTGSIFMECESGYFHASRFSDVLFRDPRNLEVLPSNQSGLIQVMSNLPISYPGHILLTEDLGTLVGEDDCSCGRKGKYFVVDGRLPQSEIRGCSDTHQERD